MFQLERLKEVGKTLENIWEEMSQGYVDEDDFNLLQEAVYCQVDINRIVWKLNSLLFDGGEEPVLVQNWIPIEYRPGTEEEYAEFSKYGSCPRSEFKVYTNKMPEDGQDVLITTKWGTVCEDIFHDDVDSVYFEDHDDPDDVIAWMPKPKGYVPEVDNEDS